jgi:hypothetical protein
MEPGLCDLRRRLTLWGRISRALGIGYPTMSSHEKARIGRGGVFNGPHMPDDLIEIDVAIARAPPQHKLMLVEVYTKEAHWREHAARLHLSEDGYFRRKKKAEVFLYRTLTSADGIHMLRAS